jgi:hypothetical protein
LVKWLHSFCAPVAFLKHGAEIRPMMVTDCGMSFHTDMSAFAQALRSLEITHSFRFHRRSRTRRR